MENISFNELRDYIHSIKRKRDGIVKVQLQKIDNNRNKHSFLYGYTQSANYYDCRLVGKKEDSILIDTVKEHIFDESKEQNGPTLVKRK